MSSDDMDAEGYSRRTVIGTICGTGLAGLAGCGGGGDGGSGGESGGSTPADSDGAGDGSAQPEPTATPTATSGGATEASGGCPSLPLSYARREVVALGGTDPLVSVEVPDESFARVRVSSGTVSISLDSAVFNVEVFPPSEDAVDALVADRVEGTTLTEITDEYEFGDGVRAVEREYDAATGGRVTVYFPQSGGGSFSVTLSRSASDWCPEVASAVYQRLIESVQRV